MNIIVFLYWEVGGHLDLKYTVLGYPGVNLYGFYSVIYGKGTLRHLFAELPLLTLARRHRPLISSPSQVAIPRLSLSGTVPDFIYFLAFAQLGIINVTSISPTHLALTLLPH